MFIIGLALAQGLLCHATHAEVRINGATINNASADYNQITGNGSDTVRKEMLDQMIASTEVFTFDTVIRASDHCDVRRSVIAAMKSMNTNGGIDWGYSSGGNYSYPGDFYAVSPSERKYFMAPYLPASLAIQRLEQSVTRTECTGAVDGAILIGHRTILGDLFLDTQIPYGSVVIDGSRTFMRAATDSTLVPGDWFYVSNHPDYEVEAKRYLLPRALPGTTITLRWYGENFIYIGGRKASGLGMDSLTIGEVRQLLADAFRTDTGIRLSDMEISMHIGVRLRERIQIHSN